MEIKRGIRKSLSKKYATIIGFSIGFFLVGAAILWLSLYYIKVSYINQHDILKKKESLTVEIYNTINKTIIDVRGYFAYGNLFLKDNALAYSKVVKKLQQEFEKVATTEEDKRYLTGLRQFSGYYFNEFLPKAFSDYENNQLDDVAKVANSVTIARTISFQEDSQKYNLDLSKKVNESFNRLIRLQTNAQLAFIFFILIILLTLLQLTRIMFRNVGKSVAHLASVANELADGNVGQIEHLHSNREDELGDLSTAFYKMVEKVMEKEQDLRLQNEKLSEVNQIKSEFVNTVSHELRTPLASILGFTELMLNRDLKPDRQQKYLTTIYNEAKRLTALINDLLDVQRMEAGKQVYEKKFIELKPILEKVIETQQIHSNKHQFRLIIESKEGLVLGDKDKIEQVLTNLVNNAIKYSPNGGLIELKLSQNQDRVLIDVKDHGLGIPKESISKLFTKFYRIDNSDRKRIGGTGLGLAIVEEIMKAHNGEVFVTSEYGKGSIFTCSFPLVPAQSEITLASNTKESAYKVLVIEDDQILGELISHELKESGFQVSYYKSGEEALNAIKKDIPDSIVLDILLEEEEIDGWDIMQKVKSDKELKNIPIFVSTALDEKEKGFSLGASDYLIKPYKTGQLSKVIMQTLLKMGKLGQVYIPEE